MGTLDMPIATIACSGGMARVPDLRGEAQGLYLVFCNDLQLLEECLLFLFFALQANNTSDLYNAYCRQK